MKEKACVLHKNGKRTRFLKTKSQLSKRVKAGSVAITKSAWEEEYGALSKEPQVSSRRVDISLLPLTHDMKMFRLEKKKDKRYPKDYAF